MKTIGGVYRKMNKTQKNRIHDAFCHGSFLTSCIAVAWTTELVLDKNIWGIATWLVGWTYIILFCIANKIWERMA